LVYFHLLVCCTKKNLATLVRQAVWPEVYCKTINMLIKSTQCWAYPILEKWLLKIIHILKGL
jgi:hypothetical protein